MSDYHSADASTAMLKNLRADFIPHGLFLVYELPETVSKTIAAEWNSQTAGGSHLNPDWKKNPSFQLKLRGSGPAKIKIVLSRPEKDWKNKCIKDSVGCMMGFYLTAGTKAVCTSPIFHEVWQQS
ncbi:unnamed protein product [Choristocarpus tenellus]